MKKRIIAAVMCSILLLCSALLPSASATSDDTEAENIVTVYMNGQPLSERENGSQRYTYVTPSLDSALILTCDFNRDAYSCLITQPTEKTGYIGTVSLTEKESGEVSRHIVRVYDNNTFKNHFINLGGDPWVTYHDGWYYYMYTGNGFYVSRSRELERVYSNPVSVFSMSNLVDGVNFNIVKELWAPELHFIDGYWYIYFTAYDGESYKENSTTEVTGTAKNHRMYVLKSKTDNALGEYEFMGQIKEIDSDYINDPDYNSETYKPGHFAIDQTVFQYGGKLYAVWSGWDGYVNLEQRIYIAEMSDPCTISSARVELSRPEYSYETYSVIPAINEAPQALISPDGTLNISFSVNRFDDSHYSLALLTLKENGNPLDPTSWLKSDKAVFETSLNNSTYSVGHCSFVPSPDLSESYVVYHARSGEDTDKNPREVRVQQFYWNDDGTPSFDEALSAADPVQIPSGTAEIERTKLEAENGELSPQAVIPDAQSSTTYPEHYYSAGRRVALTKSGAYVTFRYTSPKAGAHTLTLLGSGTNTNGHQFGVSVEVNGTEYKKRFLGNANNINNFAYYDLTGIELIEGENIIKVAYTSTYKNGAYLDRLDITNEADANAAFAAKDKENAQNPPSPVIRETFTEAELLPDYGRQYTFNSFGDFDKYWYSTQPFVTEYEDVITTCRPGGHKRLFVTGEEFSAIADFKASVEVSPSVEHTLENGNTVSSEVISSTGSPAVSSGLLFRVSDNLFYSSNTVTFSGYRCMLIVGKSGNIKLQLHQYYFTDDTKTKTGSKLIAESNDIAYEPGATYKIEISVIGDSFSATAAKIKDSPTPPESVDTTLSEVAVIENKSLTTTVGANEKYGRIGLFANQRVGRITFSNMTVTPYYAASSDTAKSDFDNLSALSSYTAYTTSSSNTHSVSNSEIKNPASTSKLILKDSAAQSVSDFTAAAKIEVTATNSAIQAGFGFRLQNVVTASPGLTGYAVFLQRTSTRDINEIVINWTKYGTHKTNGANKNLGNQSYVDKTLLSDITDKSQIYGLEFNFRVTVEGNLMTAIISRADKPELLSEYLWVLDDPDYSVNKTYPVYYESGMIGIFSHGTSKFSDISFDVIGTPHHRITTSPSEGGSVCASTEKALKNRNITLTARADSGYYLSSVSAKSYDGTTAKYSTVELSLDTSLYDTEAVYSFTMPEKSVELSYKFSKILSGDSNLDGTVGILDLIRLKKHLAQSEAKIGFSNSDISGDKTLSSTDLSQLRIMLLKRENEQ